MAQENLRKLLHLIELLMYNDKNRRNTSAIADKLDVSIRTVQRLIHTLDVSGFVIDRLEPGVYYLRRDKGTAKDFSQLMHFTEEEAYILAQLVASLKGESRLKNNLHKKILRFYATPRKADLLIDTALTENINRLAYAIDQKKCVELQNYRSANSNKTSSRLVEPYNFTSNYNAVVCLDHADKVCKTFVIARIGTVVILNETWIYEDLHQELHVDMFRNTAERPVGKVIIRLNTRAYNLLMEEYPLAEKSINGQPPDAIFEAEVQRYEGPGRFVLGLMDDVEVLGDNGFINFLREKLAKAEKIFKSERKRQNLT